MVKNTYQCILFEFVVRGLGHYKTPFQLLLQMKVNSVQIQNYIVLYSRKINLCKF